MKSKQTRVWGWCFQKSGIELDNNRGGVGLKAPRDTSKVPDVFLVPFNGHVDFVLARLYMMSAGVTDKPLNNTPAECFRTTDPRHRRIGKDHSVMRVDSRSGEYVQIF